MKPYQGSPLEPYQSSLRQQQQLLQHKLTMPNSIKYKLHSFHNPVQSLVGKSVTLLYRALTWITNTESRRTDIYTAVKMTINNMAVNKG